MLFPVPFDSSDRTYEQIVKERLEESVLDYLDDDVLSDDLCDHLKAVLVGEYKRHQEQADKVKLIIHRMFPEEFQDQG